MADCIPYQKIDYYSNLIIDYLSEKESIKFAYHRFPTLENFKKQLEEKGQNFPDASREILVSSLKKQYHNFKVSPKTQENIDLLDQHNTFTITTGHQLNLFTGPLYFLYKIISVINLTKELGKTYPDYNFVPIFWMASEDHDFDEIRYFNYKGKKYAWESNQTGAVGRFSNEGLDEVFGELAKDLNSSEEADFLRILFSEAYLNHETLAEAMRYMGNELFGKYGLVIVDGDDIALKKLFIPYLKDELLHQTAFEKVNTTAEKLIDLGYFAQVNPREINLFYLGKNNRERIVSTNEKYFLVDSEKEFSKEEILQELQNSPEKFSPNALLRPLYQEVILPNLCYVGGSGELAYWLELKDYFASVKVTFPVLLMRNSAVLISDKQQDKLEKLQLDQTDLFLKQDELLEKRTRMISDIPIDFTPQKEFLKQQFEDLYRLAEKTDLSFLGAVAAQEKKQTKGLAHLEKRLLKAQKKVLKDELNRVVALQDQLFPNQNLQERVVNFSEYYEQYGTELIEVLFKELKPLDMEFNILKLKLKEQDLFKLK